MDLSSDLSKVIKRFFIKQKKNDPEQLISVTSDLSRMLYSQLHDSWIWEYLRAEAVGLGTSIIVSKCDNPILFKVKAHFLQELLDFPHPCEAILHLKVLVALISRNAIRLTIEDFKELFSILETLSQHLVENKVLIEMILHTNLILVSLYEDYSCFLSTQQIMSNLSIPIEGKRLLYSLMTRVNVHLEIPKEINECFGFNIRIPESILVASLSGMIKCIPSDIIEREYMDDRCLTAYLSIGEARICYNDLTTSLLESSDLHYHSFIIQVIDKTDIKLPEDVLFEIAKKHPDKQYRVLLFCLYYSKKSASPYQYTFYFNLDIRLTLSQAHGHILEALLPLLTEQMPWFFIPALAEVP